MVAPCCQFLSAVEAEVLVKNLVRIWRPEVAKDHSTMMLVLLVLPRGLSLSFLCFCLSHLLLPLRRHLQAQMEVKVGGGTTSVGRLGNFGTSPPSQLSRLVEEIGCIAGWVCCCCGCKTFASGCNYSWMTASVGVVALENVTSGWGRALFGVAE